MSTQLKKIHSNIWVVCIGSNSFQGISYAGKPQVVSRFFQIYDQYTKPRLGYITVGGIFADNSLSNGNTDFFFSFQEEYLSLVSLLGPNICGSQMQQVSTIWLNSKTCLYKYLTTKCLVSNTPCYYITVHF